MSLSHSILGFLAYGRMTGYDLSKAFGSSVRFFWHAQASHIYLELKKLEQKQFVTCEQVLQTEKPNKKLYEITEAGRREFLRWLASEGEGFGKGTKDAFLLRIFFSGNHPPEVCIGMLTAFAADCRRQLDEMGAVPASIRSYGGMVDERHSIYWGLTADFGNRYMQMCVDWAESAVRRLEELR